MSRVREERRRDLQKPALGCMGRMIDIFDLSSGMAGTKLLTDRAHRDGSPVSRNRFDMVKRAVDPVGIHVEDRPITNGTKKSSSSKKAGGTPMKMLIAREMLKETNSKQKPPSVVARLMGLDDALPAQHPVLTSKKSSPEAYSRSKSVGSFRRHQEQEDVYINRSRSHEIHSCSHEKEYNDVYQVGQQPLRTSRTRDQAPLKGRGNENPNDKRMALVRQKFMEAKRLATDEKLLQSKEFQDALEVLSSNRDLFLKFLEEPNSLFSKHMKDLNGITPNPQTKHITVLKPSKISVPKTEKHVKTQQGPLSSGNERETNSLHHSSTVSHGKVRNVAQPTRIVVLKPSPAKTHDKKVTSAPNCSPEFPQPSDCHRGFETGEAMGSREIAKEITRQMLESVNRHQRDESLISSVLSNGYIGDDSSFYKSENDAGEDIGNFSDSEIMTPTSQNSWDYNHRMGSPYLLSSFSRASYSPESSVIREAKKRLSERWAMVATNGTRQEHMHGQSSSTLGEVLAISEVKKDRGNEVVTILSSRSCGEEEDLRAPAACLTITQTRDIDDWESSPRTLSRSRSLPVSSSCYEDIGLDVETSNSQINTFIVPKEVKKSKSGKPSLKGIVSSFFSRSKKSVRQETIPSPLVAADDRFQSDSTELVCTSSDDLSRSFYDSFPARNSVVNPEEESGNSPFPALGKNGAKQGTSSCKVGISLGKPRTSENLSKNIHKLGVPAIFSEHQDQPSPTSVLDAPFVDDVHVPLSSEKADAGCRKVLSRSAPIESVVRSLSWDDSQVKISLPNPLELPQEDEEEQELVMFVESLLSSAGFDNEKVNTVFTRWHSLESPLDAMLLVKLLDRKEEEIKCRERRSSHRLLFDCVNAALWDIGKAVISSAYPWARAHGEAWKNSQPGALISEEVCRLLRDWFSCDRQKRMFGDMDNSSLAVDRLLREEVAGREWTELTRKEIDDISKDIGEEVLADLVGEALLDITCEFS